MSVLVKGMEMPMACQHGKCNFACSAAYQTGLICIVRKQYVAPGDVPVDCPCSLVPPHGRLIDADALKVKAIERSEKCGVCVNVLDKVIAAYDIEIAPTIIPADLEEEEMK